MEEHVDNEVRFRRLRLYNIVMGTFHLAQSIVIFLLSNNYTLPITTSFLSYDTSTRTLKPVTETIINLPLGPMISLFLLLSAIAHYTISFSYSWYVNNLKKGINYARWFEYSLSASVMIVLIGQLCGMYDVASLLMAFVLTGVMNLCGLLMEVHNQTTPRTNWTAFTVGSIAGIAPWIALAIYFFGSLSTSNGNVPTFVYFVLPTLFVFFFSFALNMWLQYKKAGPWKDYLFGERAYILLSLVAKSALAWQVFAGTLRPA
jgi:hypothetical protein